MRVLLCLVSCLLVASCASGDKNSADSSARKTMSQRFNGKTVTQDAQGNWPADVRGKAVAESGKQSTYFTEKSDMGKPYQSGEFAKQQWWGGKAYDTKAYQGTPDGSRFQTAARDQGKGAREAGTVADSPGLYQTGAYQTGNAREASGRRFDKPRDAATQNRRERFPEAEVQGWEEQRRMDLNTTKGILGR